MNIIEKLNAQYNMYDKKVPYNHSQFIVVDDETLKPRYAKIKGYRYYT
jgi:hypothetical protein